MFGQKGIKYCATYHDTLQFPQWDFYFILFYLGGGRLQEQMEDTKGQGNEWDWTAWWKFHQKIDKNFL